MGVMEHGWQGDLNTRTPARLIHLRGIRQTAVRKNRNESRSKE